MAETMKIVVHDPRCQQIVCCCVAMTKRRFHSSATLKCTALTTQKQSSPATSLVEVSAATVLRENLLVLGFSFGQWSFLVQCPPKVLYKVELSQLCERQRSLSPLHS